MLYLYFGDKKNALLSGESYFDAWVDTAVLESDFGKSVVNGIENGIVYSRNNIVIPVIGSIPPDMLSGGTKTLLCLYYNSNLLVDLAAMGDNCFSYLSRLATDRDIYACTDSYRELYEHGFIGDIFVQNFNVTVNNAESLYTEWCKYYERFL